MRKSHHHKRTLRFLLLLSFFCSGIGFAQDKIYFNKDWFVCQKEDAKFYRILEEADTLLKVTDYYSEGSKQSEGFILNTKSNREILKIRGDFEQKTIGECNYYRKNGKLYYSVNMHPFDENHGIDPKHFDLLKNVDTVAIDSSELQFETYFYNNSTDYGFMLDEEIPHGAWLNVDLETGVIINRTLHSLGKLHGVSFIYWKNGKIREESPYVNGVYHGEVKKYNKDGILVKGKEYENGDLIETWIYHKSKKKKS
ncbi:MAG: hypothetical protein P8P74_02635 [Crocinitomicaceae bacterium]|nr:hypothetical protein [Crocinitomicaceae bacterium]